MNAHELFKLSGLRGEIDTALPQHWFDRCLEIGIRNPCEVFVWWYNPEPGMLFGEPLSIGRMYAECIENGSLVEAAKVDRRLERHLDWCEENLGPWEKEPEQGASDG